MLRKLGYIAVTSTLLLATGSCGRTAYYFRDLQIDSGLHLIRNDRITGYQHPTAGSYYWFMHTATELFLVDHFAITPDGHPKRLLSLVTDKNKVLLETRKSDQILDGPFGVVYVDRKCFYRPLSSGYRSSVSVGSHFKPPLDEVPAEVPGPPQGLPPLTSVALIRIFRSDSKFFLASANYEAGGRLGSVYFAEAAKGDAVPGRIENVTIYGLRRDTQRLKGFGIPEQLDIARYLQNRRIALAPTDLIQERNIIVTIYGYGEVFRLDELRDGIVARSRWLQPSATAEERVLNPKCDAGLRQQQAAGISTVQ